MAAAEALGAGPLHRNWKTVYANEYATVLMHEDHRRKALVVPRRNYSDVSEMLPLGYEAMIKLLGRTASSLMGRDGPHGKVSMTVRHTERHGGRQVYFALQAYELS